MKNVTYFLVALYALLVVTSLLLALDSFFKYGPTRQVAELLKGISFVCLTLYFLAKICAQISERNDVD